MAKENKQILDTVKKVDVNLVKRCTSVHLEYEETQSGACVSW